MLRFSSTCLRISHQTHHIPRHYARFHNNSPMQEKLTQLGFSAKLAFTTITVGGVAAYFLVPDVSRSAPTSSQECMAPNHFTLATVTSTTTSGPDTKLIELTIPPQLLPASPTSPLAPIWSIFVKDDDIQVERPYTPLNGVDEHGRMQFWIKKYPKGEVGRWLHTKNTGDQVEIRGPLTTWPWNEDAWDDIIMISGGTGIAPFFQLFSTIIKNQPKVGHKTRYTLLHSSRTPTDLPPPTIMEPLATFALNNPDIFRFHLFVDQNAISTPPASLDFQVGRIDRNTIIKYLAAPNSKGWVSFFQKSEQAEARKTLFLVCGPEPMINAICGPYGRNFSQGPVGGVLRELGLSSKQVYKL